MKKYFLAIFMFLTSFSSQGQSLSGKESQVYNEVFIKCVKGFDYMHQAIQSRDYFKKSPQEAFNNLKQAEKKHNATIKKNLNPKFNVSFSDAQLKKIVNDVYFGKYKYASENDIPNSFYVCNDLAHKKANRSTKNWQPIK